MSSIIYKRRGKYIVSIGNNHIRFDEQPTRGLAVRFCSDSDNDMKIYKDDLIPVERIDINTLDIPPGTKKIIFYEMYQRQDGNGICSRLEPTYKIVGDTLAITIASAREMIIKNNKYPDSFINKKMINELLKLDINRLPDRIAGVYFDLTDNLTPVPFDFNDVLLTSSTDGKKEILWQSQSWHYNPCPMPNDPLKTKLKYHARIALERLRLS